MGFLVLFICLYHSGSFIGFLENILVIKLNQSIARRISFWLKNKKGDGKKLWAYLKEISIYYMKHSESILEFSEFSGILEH